MKCRDIKYYLYQKDQISCNTPPPNIQDLSKILFTSQLYENRSQYHAITINDVAANKKVNKKALLISGFIRNGSEKTSTLIEGKWTQVLEKPHQSSQAIFQIHLMLLLSHTSCAHYLIRTKAVSFELLQE